MYRKGNWLNSVSTCKIEVLIELFMRYCCTLFVHLYKRFFFPVLNIYSLLKQIKGGKPGSAL